MHGLRDHAYLVTGGASGIGAGVVRRLLEDGARAVVLDLNQPGDPNDTAGFPRDRVVYERGSVTDEERVAAAVATGVEAFGRLDGVVNNAGRLLTAPVDQIDFDEWRAMLDVNVGGYLLAAKHAWPHLRNAGGGAIINCASIMAYNSAPGAAAYSAAKAAVLGLTRAIANDGAPLNIRCNAVCPGTVDTPMLHRYLDDKPDPDAERDRLTAMYPLGRLGKPGDVAALVAFLLSDDAAWITGQDFVIDGGFLARGTND